MTYQAKQDQKTKLLHESIYNGVFDLTDSLYNDNIKELSVAKA